MANQLPELLLKNRAKLYQDDLTLWIAMHHHRTTSDTRMKFSRGHGLFIPIYLDKNPTKVFKKCVQIGISEYLICLLMSYLYQGHSVLYTLPTIELRNTFVANRIDPLIDSVPFYRDGARGARGTTLSRSLKHLWQGTCKFVGTNSAISFLEYMADLLIIDEKDASNLELLVKADDRQQHSLLKHKVSVANPTKANHGIDIDWAKSDQKDWHVNCPSCGKPQFIDWWKNVVRQIDEGRYKARDAVYATRAGKKYCVEAWPVCTKCRKRLDRLGPGHWYAAAGSDISGYHISNVNNPFVPLAQLVNEFDEAAYNNTLMERFVNSQLGETFSAPGACLTAEILDKYARRDFVMSKPTEKTGLITAGFDVNFPQLNGRISIWNEDLTVRKALWIGIVYGFAELNNLLDKFEVDFVGIDIAPERNKVTDWIREADNRYAIEYPTRTTKYDNREGWHVDTDSRIVKVERTRWIDAMIAAIYRGENLLPQNFASLENGEYLKQLTAAVRLIDYKKYPPVAYWHEGTKTDHFLHAEVYDYVAGMLAKLVGDMRPRITTLGA